MALPVEAWRLEGISPRAYQHPADRAATAALQKVPYLDEVVRKLIALGYERALRVATLGAAVRLGQQQLPHIWVLHRQVFNTLDVEQVPDLYMTQFPIANAGTFGTERPVVVLNSELVRLLDDDGRRAVLAHEAAHVLADHVLYGTALQILLLLGRSVRLPLLAGLPLRAVTAALMEWFRAAELTCDRTAALVTRDPLVVCRTLMRLTAGSASDQLNLDAYLKQAGEYREGGKGLDRLQRLWMELGVTHALPVKRVHEVMEWVRTGEYDRIMGSEYPKRSDPVDVREQADEAVNFYRDRFASTFREAGENLASASDQLADWLRNAGKGEDD